MFRKILFGAIFGLITSVASHSQAAVVWQLTILDSTGNSESNFAVGESGFIDVSVGVSGAELADVPVSYQALISLDTEDGIAFGPAVDSNLTPNPGDDIHPGSPVLLSVSDTNLLGYGEADIFTTATSTPASTSLFRLPFTITELTPTTHTFSIVQTADGEITFWNETDETASVFGPAATASLNVTAVPEPGSVAICGLLCAGVAANQRRKAKRRKAATI